MKKLSRNLKLIASCIILQCGTGFMDGFLFKGDALDRSRSYIDEVKAKTRQSPELAEAGEAELKTYTPYRIQNNIDDPFTVKNFVMELGNETLVNDAADCLPEECGDGPPIPHTPYFLENYNLDELSLTGTMTSSNKGKIALIQTPGAGIVYTSEGEYIGRNNGLVLSITREKIIVREKYRSAQGWQDRMATLPLIRN